MGRSIVCPKESPCALCRDVYLIGFLADYGPKGVQGGNVGKRVPSGHNRRRRLATRSSGKQQAERTAVRAAPIVCPEESPQCARRCIPLPHYPIGTPTPRRGAGGERKAPCQHDKRQLCRKKFPFEGD